MRDFWRQSQSIANATATATAPTYPNGSSYGSTITSTTVESIEDQIMCENLADFSTSYDVFHGYLCLAICIFGAMANLLNIIVLTRKEMHESPINRILTGNILIFISLFTKKIP